MTGPIEDICAMCKHFEMKKHPAHAKVGLGRCGGYDNTMTPLANPFAPWMKRACVRFVLGPNLTARQEWIAKQRTKQKDTVVQPETKG